MSEMLEHARWLIDSRDIVEDLTANWDAFCDADPLPHRRDQYPECMESRGHAEMVSVDADELQSSFAEERGIRPGVLMWRLTPAGLALRGALASLSEDKGS